MRPSQQAHRIDQAVRYWEDSAYALNITERSKKAIGEKSELVRGPILNAPTFRKSLLGSVSETFDRERFLEPMNEMIHMLGAWAFVPELVHAWSRKSRRVYHLPRDVQALLNATSLRRLTWESVQWPFDAFAVTLDKHVIDGGNHHDCIMVRKDLSRETGQLRVDILLLPVWLDEYVSTTRDERNQLEQWLKKRRLDKLAIRMLILNKSRHRSQPPYLRINIEDPRNERIVKAISPRTRLNYMDSYTAVKKVRGNESPLLETMLRLVVGLSLYVTLRPSGVSPLSGWEDVESIPGGDLNIVTRAAQTCFVQSAYTLTPEEVRIYEGETNEPHVSIEKSPHFRCGFWRRPPGEGQNPLAQKTVWVQPTIVRRDRLRPNQLPRGYEANVLRPKRD